MDDQCHILKAKYTLGYFGPKNEFNLDFKTYFTKKITENLIPK